MKKFSALLWLALVLIPLSATAAEPLRVVAGTSLISDIVADLTEGKSETLTLIQGSSCPGHENASTGDYVFAAKSKLLLVHPFQRHLQQVDAMGTKMAVPNQPLEILRTLHSFDPCLACSTHIIGPDGSELISVRTDNCF